MAICCLTLAACGPTAQSNPRQAYIDAMVEFKCSLFEEDITGSAAMESKAKEVFASYGFPVDDEAEMDKITAPFEDDDTVYDEIDAAATEKCRGDLYDTLKMLE